MYLYELALELDERSAELAARARSLGVDGAGPATQLTAEQVAALRSGCEHRTAVPALAWMTGATDLDAPAGRGRSSAVADRDLVEVGRPARGEDAPPVAVPTTDDGARRGGGAPDGPDDVGKPSGRWRSRIGRSAKLGG